MQQRQMTPIKNKQRIISKKDTRMTNQCVNRCPMPSFQGNTNPSSVRFTVGSLTPKRQTIRSISEDVEKLELPPTAGGGVEWSSPSENSWAVAQESKHRATSPGWCGSVDWVPAYEPKGHGFYSQSGHMPGLRACNPMGPQWGVCNSQPHVDVSLRLSPVSYTHLTLPTTT